MTTESEQSEIPDEMSSEEARQYLIWFLGREDFAGPAEIYRGTRHRTECSWAELRR